MAVLTQAGRDATWRERSATFMVFMVLGLGIGIWAAALPRLKADLGLSDRDLSFALLAVAIGASSPAGRRE